MKHALLLALVFAAAHPAWGQFELYLVNGNIEQPVVQAYDFGDVEPGAPLAVPFRIRNVSAAAATLDLLTVNGAGFSIPSANAPSIPVSLGSEQAVDFTVQFQSAGTGIYSAALESVGISVILTATVPVEFTCQAIVGSAVQNCAAAPVNFGSVPVGQNPTVEFILLNQTSAALTAPGPLVSGAGFSLYGASPAGAVIQPAASIAFEVQFSPTAPGAATGTLALGSRSYTLLGTGVEPPFPQPQISLTLPNQASAQQGTVAIALSAPPQMSGTGTVTIAFVPEPSLAADPADPGIVFASGGQSATFGVLIGQAQAYFGTATTLPFQTGTTAGTLTVTAQLGSNSVQQSVIISPAPVGFTAIEGVRSAGTVEVDLTGFDNTRSAGALAFTFYDAAGNQVAPPVQANGSAEFASYFQTSAGGAFALKAVFPVLGDTSQIASFQAVVTNSVGMAATALTNF